MKDCFPPTNTKIQKLTQPPPRSAKMSLMLSSKRTRTPPISKSKKRSRRKVASSQIQTSLKILKFRNVHLNWSENIGALKHFTEYEIEAFMTEKWQVHLEGSTRTSYTNMQVSS